MSYDFWIPTEPEVDQWTRATLTEDGELILHDYDLEEDLVLDIFGEETIALRVARAWKYSPIDFLCSKIRFLPIKDNGLAAWAWARMAVDARLEEEDLKEHLAYLALLENSLDLAYSALTKKKMPFKKLIVANRDVSNMIVHATSFHRGQYVLNETGYAMTAVKHLLNGLIEMVQQREETGGIGTIGDFCAVALYASGAIEKSPQTWRQKRRKLNEPILIEVAIETMGDVQEARGGLK